MSKREKIILLIMFVAILLGAASFLMPSSKPATNPNAGQAKLTELRDLVTKVSADLKSDDLTQRDKYILERADTPWVKDPFIGKRLMADDKGGRPGEEQTLNLAFTGYVDTGSKRLAVINGIEYEVGETLQSGGFVVRSITPEAVVLEDTEKRGKITVPFTGEVLR